MNGPLDIYGLQENAGNISWPYLFFGFLFFGIREAGHFSDSPVIGSLRYIFGIWSAIFLTFALYFIYLVIYKRGKISIALSYLPVALGLFFPVLMIYYYFSQVSSSEIKDIMSTLEALAWMLGSSVTIYTTFKLGTRVSGGFINIFMFFQFSALLAGMLRKLYRDIHGDKS
ncbi:MAG: hypothetical protein Q8N79_08090 [Candidatus Methanoperedens sp.]|nr:hypothetical protein [Candidatus Methanoperedens sp.]